MYLKDWTVSQLAKQTMKVLGITADNIPGTTAEENSIRAILGNLHGIASNIAELRNGYGSGHGKSATFSGLDARHTKLAVGTTLASSYHTWQEYRLESGSYVLKNYWMRLTTTFVASPDPRIAIAGKPDVVESGFGLEAFATTSITTNYDRPDKLVGPQMLYAFYPETFFGQSPYARYADTMATSSGNAGERTISWCYPVSLFSTVGSKLHFTPLWIPDESYPVLAQAFYAWSPVGQVYEYKSDPVTILGDMYDRVTVVRR